MSPYREILPSRLCTRTTGHEKREKRTMSRKTERKRRVRKSTGKIAGKWVNPEGSGEYLSEIDILSPLTSSPERSSTRIRLNLLYKNLNSFVSFSVGPEEAALSLFPTLLFSPVFLLLAPPRAPRSLLSTLSARILVSFARLTTFTARLALHFSFLRYFFPYISNDRLGSRQVLVLRAHR